MPTGRGGVDVLNVHGLDRDGAFDGTGLRVGQIERGGSVEDFHFNHEFVGVQLFVNDEHFHFPGAAVGPVPLRDAVGCFDHVNEACSRFNFKAAIDVSTIHVETLCGVENDVIKGVLSFFSEQVRSGRPSDENRDGGIVVGPVGVGCDVLVRIHGKIER